MNGWITCWCMKWANEWHVDVWNEPMNDMLMYEMSQWMICWCMKWANEWHVWKETINDKYEGWK